MLEEAKLKKMTLKELKETAEKENIKYKKTIKKAELIELLTKGKAKPKVKDDKKSTSKPKKSGKKTSKEIKEIFDSIPDLPKVYGRNKIVFMIRDPYNGFVYWDLKDEVIKEHNLDDEKLNKYLRVYDVTDTGSPETGIVVMDVKIDYTSYSWYINFPKPNRVYMIDLGYFKDNRFVSVLRSNSAKLPRIDVSETNEANEKNNAGEWILTSEQFEQIMQLSGADVMFSHDGSQELMKFLAGNLSENISS